MADGSGPGNVRDSHKGAFSTPDLNATLGATLHRARRHQGYSLRGVELRTGIPNAHLSQIESGKIAQPGAELIWKLADFYRLDFALLARMAGHEWAADLAERAKRAS